MLLGLQAKLTAFGGVLLGVLYLFVRLKFLKAGKERAETIAETLGARNHVIVVQRKIEKEEKRDLLLEEKAIEEKADVETPEEFQGFDNLSDDSW